MRENEDRKTLNTETFHTVHVFVIVSIYVFIVHVCLCSGTDRSNRPRVFFKKGVLTLFSQNSKEKTCTRVSLLKRDPYTGVFRLILENF